MLGSLPRFNSYHKYELPAENLLPRQPKDLAELLEQINQLLFALCFRVEDFVNAPSELYGNCPNFNPTVWAFFHEVINLLPRTLNAKDIDEAQIDLYESLHNTERVKSFTVTEQINPGADAPAPALTPLLDDEGMDVRVDVETVVNGNPACEAGEAFSLVQNALAGTDLAQYTIEFVPDEPIPRVEGAAGVDGAEEKKKDEDREEEPEEGEEEEEPPKPKTRAKAGAKGSKQAKAAKGKKATAPKKKTAAATAPAKEGAAKAATRVSSRLAAKGSGGETLHPTPSTPSSSKRKRSTLAAANAEPASGLAPLKAKCVAPTPASTAATPTPSARVPLVEQKTRVLRRDPDDASALTPINKRAPAPAPTPAPSVRVPLVEQATRVVRRDPDDSALAPIENRAAPASAPIPDTPASDGTFPVVEQPTRIVPRDAEGAPIYPRHANSDPVAVPLRVRQLRCTSPQTSTPSRSRSRSPNASPSSPLAGVSHDDVAAADVDAVNRVKKRARSEEDGAGAEELPAEKRMRVALHTKSWIPLLGAEDEDTLQRRKAEAREAHKRRNQRAATPQAPRRRGTSRAEPRRIVVNGVQFTLVTG
ncbi:hypothetical protein B0H16DRAFT_1526051 [Mycena metata]|uniref:Uncharacterized protein n=1 Tax=Mycena metata TaxID=1033252 RepID=A0AAD7JLA2_9AGAR|nr:hypothetical protein B0H16DRAFT_1526051 [Mycena metata]